MDMKMCRYEIEPRPAALGGGWRLHLIGHHPETGAEIEMGGRGFPIEPNVGGKETYRPGKTKQAKIYCKADFGRYD
jgi:hypothetical protein